MLLAVLLVVGCASGRTVSRDPEKTTDVMITFVQKAQAGFWKDAMANVTPEEREEMMEDGQVMPEYRDAVNRIRLSTVKNMDLGLDGKGRLVGLINILDESNSMYRASDEKVEIDPSKLEDLSIKRQKAEEEAAKRFQEAANVPETSEWDIYYSKPKSASAPEADAEEED
jgi:uncharacterized protein YjiS (DUF1127 family)